MWDDAPWDSDGYGGPPIAVSDTFSVTMIEQGNRVLRLTPQSSAYQFVIKSTDWDDLNVWQVWPVPFTAGQVFTVTAVDLSNRVVWLSG